MICSIETGWIALLIFALALINSISHMTLCVATDLITQELKLSLIEPKYSFVLWKFSYYLILQGEWGRVQALTTCGTRQA